MTTATESAALAALVVSDPPIGYVPTGADARAYIRARMPDLAADGRPVQDPDTTLTRTREALWEAYRIAPIGSRTEDCFRRAYMAETPAAPVVETPAAPVVETVPDDPTRAEALAYIAAHRNDSGRDWVSVPADLDAADMHALVRMCYLLAPDGSDDERDWRTVRSNLLDAARTETATETADETDDEDAAGYDEDGNALTQSEIDHDYTYSEIQDCYVRDRDVASCADYDGAMSRGWRRNNCYCAESGTWYVHEENRDEDDAENAPSEDSEDGDLFEYSENVLDHFPRSYARDALVFGAELEMEPNDSSQSDIIETLGGKVGDRFILKSDGSLDSGVELVTMPLTLAEHRKYWAPILTRALKRVAQSGAGTENCGMHVHINRGALSALTLGKMLVMCNSERPAMVALLETIAQRKANSWAQRCEKKLTDGRASRSDHYEMLSLSGKRTAELRIFRGNLRADRVIKNLEFAHALVMYCRDASALDVEDAAAFLRWLLKNRHHYSVLVAFLAERGTVALPVKSRPPLKLDGNPPAETGTTNEES